MRRHERDRGHDAGTLLEVTDLVKHFPIKRGVLIDREVDQVRAVDGVSFKVERGETLGLVGESGSGKSTACRAVLQLIEPTSGSVRFEGREIAGLGRREMRPLRREMQMIFQDPYASLNPRKRVGQIVGDPLKRQGVASGSELRRQVQELLERVGLSSEHYNRFPHEFSGGQRQRIGIARALALKPKLVICDEPVSALDVSIQAQIVNLLDDLQDEFGLAYLFVAHDIGVVRHISDRIAVMNEGKIVEQGSADQVCEQPEGRLHEEAAGGGADPGPAREPRAGPKPVKDAQPRVASAAVDLPLSPPIKPQLALTRKALPDGEEWAYEPKLDGFRAIVFVDGDESYIQSRGGKDLNRYFPELEFAPGRWVLDGELVIRDADGNLEFDSLQERIHPAQSRIELLSKEIPAGYIVFDLLAEGDEALLERPLRERRERLEAIAAKAGLELTPLTTDTAQAEKWLGSIEGVMAKDLDRALRPRQTQGDGEGQARADDRLRGDGLAAGQRGGHGRLADPRPLRRRRACAPSATSPASAPPPNAACGRCWRRWRRARAATAEPSRWTGGRDLEWVELRPELVIEVGYDHAASGRIRHGARFHGSGTTKSRPSAASSSWTKALLKRWSWSLRGGRSPAGPALWPALSRAAAAAGRPGCRWGRAPAWPSCGSRSRRRGRRSGRRRRSGTGPGCR